MVDAMHRKSSGSMVNHSEAPNLRLVARPLDEQAKLTWNYYGDLGASDPAAYSFSDDRVTLRPGAKCL